MKHLRSWFLPGFSGLVLAGVIFGALVNAGNARQPAHDHPHAPLTLEDVKRQYNPKNSPNVTIVENPNGTFTITHKLRAEE